MESLRVSLRMQRPVTAMESESIATVIIVIIIIAAAEAGAEMELEMAMEIEDGTGGNGAAGAEAETWTETRAPARRAIATATGLATGLAPLVVSMGAEAIGTWARAQARAQDPQLTAPHSRQTQLGRLVALLRAHVPALWTQAASGFATVAAPLALAACRRLLAFLLLPALLPLRHLARQAQHSPLRLHRTRLPPFQRRCLAPARCRLQRTGAAALLRELPLHLHLAAQAAATHLDRGAAPALVLVLALALAEEAMLAGLVVAMLLARVVIVALVLATEAVQATVAVPAAEEEVEVSTMLPVCIAGDRTCRAALAARLILRCSLF